MGNRANFVIVKNQDWQLYYSHWGGCRMLDALIGGPDLALRYAASLQRCEKDDWCDSSWAEGGSLIDLDRRRVSFFGEPLMVEMNERRALMEVLAMVWPGYEICWAYDGTAAAISAKAAVASSTLFMAISWPTALYCIFPELSHAGNVRAQACTDRL